LHADCVPHWRTSILTGRGVEGRSLRRSCERSLRRSRRSRSRRSRTQAGLHVAVVEGRAGTAPSPCCLHADCMLIASLIAGTAPSPCCSKCCSGNMATRAGGGREGGCRLRCRCAHCLINCLTKLPSMLLPYRRCSCDRSTCWVSCRALIAGHGQ
jgi:hypothetical protein